MTRRNRRHSRIESRIAHLLWSWIATLPAPRGGVYSGEAGFILRSDPDSIVGIDVAYVSAEREAAQTDATTLIEGPPVLAVEVLSPSDRKENVDEKVAEYLASGVALVWTVDPRFRTITVFRDGAEPELFNVNQRLSGEPHLPGFDLPVAEIFA